MIGQSERPETIIVPVSSLGDVSEVRKQILQNTLTDELKKHFRIVSQEKYEQVLEQVFEELEYEECSEDTCIMRLQEILQVENMFNLQVLGENKDTQLNLTWRTLDEKKNETDVCLGCGTFQLNDKVKGLVEKLVGEKRVEVVVQKKQIVVVKKKPIIVERPNVVVEKLENEMDGVKTDVKVEPTIEIEQKLIQKPKEVEKTIYEPLNIRVRGLYGSVQSGETSVTNLSYLVIWNKFGFGQTQLTYKTKSSSGDEFDVSNSTLDFSYTIMEEWNVTIGVGFVSQGQGSITSSNKEYTSTDVSGNGLFIIGGFDLDKLEITGGLRRNSFEFKGFNSGSTNHSVSGIQLIFGVGWSF